MSEVEQHEDASYWPGYVDAIFNFALNILFVLSVFVVIASIIDFSEATQEQESREVQPSNSLNSVISARPNTLIETANNVELIHVPDAPFSVQSEVSPGEPQPQTPSTLIDSPRLIDEGTSLVTIDFVGGSVSISPERLDELRMMLDSLISGSSPQEWLIWTSIDGRETTQARLAYIRLMAVRSTLLESGIPASNISLRLLDVRDAGTANQSRVFLTAFSPNL